MNAPQNKPYNEPRSRLGLAIHALMCTDEYTKTYPAGATAYEILEELDDRFPLCTWLDVYDELRYMYGSPRQH